MSESVDSFIKEMNRKGSQREPFFFMIDFEMLKPRLYPLDKIPSEIKFSIDHDSENILKHSPKGKIRLRPKPVEQSVYKKAFEEVLAEINYGNSFLLNLTFPTEIQKSLDLLDIYNKSSARYKLYVEDEMVVFSPEIFVKIKDGMISSYPMKGTIDASIKDAEEIISKDQKEIAEHYTIVDLIRNDMSIVAKDVKVKRFRYAEKIRSSHKTLFQISSEIEGKLPKDYHEQIGSILFKMLPAGSISGAPKKKTLDIISKTELGRRGYYTGVFGVFDGVNLDSGVMIRYIEKRGEQFFYRSGGGITFQSEMQTEYQELIDKIYVPIY